MTLRGTKSASNIESSLNAYMASQLVDLYNYLVIFPRETWPDAELPGRWIEVSYVPMAEEFATTRVQVGWGSNRMLLVNANCWEQTQEQLGQTGGLAGQYTLTAMVDQVMDTLGPRAAIPLRDYATAGNPTVAYFGWRASGHSASGGSKAQGLEQWNVYARSPIPRSMYSHVSTFARTITQAVP